MVCYDALLLLTFSCFTTSSVCFIIHNHLLLLQHIPFDICSLIAARLGFSFVSVAADFDFVNALNVSRTKTTSC